MQLKGTKTHENLKAAFAGESQANRRYLYFAAKADVEGQNDVAAVFRSTAEGETGTRTGTSNTWNPSAIRRPTSRSARRASTSPPPIAGRRTNTPTCIPGMAKQARQEGFTEIADWFETLAKAERSHANRFRRRSTRWSTDRSPSKAGSMPQIARESLLSLEAYARSRSEFRARAIEHKRRRTVHVGEHLTLLFEDELTVRYQIQEMLRVERIFEEADIRGELDAYNPLVPDGSNWKATMLLEYPDPGERQARLPSLKASSGAPGCRSKAASACTQLPTRTWSVKTRRKTSSVHFLRFELSPGMVGALRHGAGLTMGADHPQYKASARSARRRGARSRKTSLERTARARAGALGRAWLRDSRKATWELETERRGWKEGEYKLPGQPKSQDLIEFYVSASTDFPLLRRQPIAVRGKDGVVRYTLLARSPSGVENVTYEGIRCAAGSFRVYALGRAGGSWAERDSDWRPIEAKDHATLAPRAVERIFLPSPRADLRCRGGHRCHCAAAGTRTQGPCSAARVGRF
jgi:rubrerythrin